MTKSKSYVFMRTVGFLGIASFLVLVVSYLEQPEAEYRQYSEYGVWGSARIIDGDSLEIKDQNIRLSGMDACEYDQTSDEGWPCGAKARAVLVDLIDGREVRCVWEKTDRYKRPLAICDLRTGELSLNEQMISAGMAVLYRGFKSRSDRSSGMDTLQNYRLYGKPVSPKDWVLLEDQARLNKRGLWGYSVNFPAAYRANNRP